MTNEEKAKAYDKALERAKAAIDIAADKDLVKGVATTIFPELRKSEDERVIRTLYYLVRDHDWVNGATKGEALAWLEKQKAKPELTWEDVQIIWMETEQYMKELRRIERTDLSKFPSSSREIFEEILRRYKEAKK